MKKASRMITARSFTRNLKLSYRSHIHNATTASATEFNNACSKCKQSVILTATYVLAWVKMCTALAN
jgi:hypothetical protein